MRVTNERAQSAIKSHHITGNLTNIVKDYASDLLEAREFIDRLFSFTNSILDGSDDYTFSKIAVKEELAKLVKEYAE